MDSINHLLNWFDKNYELEATHTKGSLSHFLDRLKTKEFEGTKSSLSEKIVQPVHIQKSSFSKVIEGEKQLEEIYLKVKMIKAKLENPTSAQQAIIEQLANLQAEFLQIKLDTINNFFKYKSKLFSTAENKSNYNDAADLIITMIKTDQIGSLALSPFAKGLKKCQTDITQLFIKNTTFSPLHYAAKLGDLETVKFFLENGFNVNQRDSEGMTPLHYAAWKGHLEIAELLVEKGADILKKDGDSFTPYQLALINRHKKLVKLFNNLPKIVKTTELKENFEDIEKQFSSFMQNCKTAEKTPFANTDLVIFPDSFPHNALPLNGIKAKEFEELVSLYNDICQNKTKIYIEGDSSFEELVKNSLKQILSRKTGRKLIREIVDSSIRKKLIIKKGLETVFIRSQDTITLSLVNNAKCSILPSGDETLIESYTFFGLAHELIHASHAFTVSEKPPVFDPKFDNLEEQRTITGLDAHLAFLDISQKESEELQTQEDLEKLFDTAYNPTYNPLNENVLRSEFGLPFRSNHQGIILPQSYYVEGDKIPQDLWKYFLSNVQNKRRKEIIHFLEINHAQDLKKKTIPDGTLFKKAVLARVIKLDALPILKVLLKCGWRLSYKDFSLMIKKEAIQILDWALTGIKNSKKIKDGNNLLHFLVDREPCIINYFDKDVAIVKILIKHGIDFNAPNNDGDTPLHMAIRNGLNEIVSYLLEIGVDTDVKNKAGKTPFYEILNNNLDLNLIKQLLDEKVNPELVPPGEEPFLFQALNTSNIRLIKLLTQYPVNVNVRNSQGQTLLHAINHIPLASIKDKVKLFHIFSKMGVPTDAKDHEGKTYIDHFDLLASQFLKGFRFDWQIDEKEIKTWRSQLP